MDSSTFANVRHHALFAEVDYNQSKNDSIGILAVVRAIEKMHEVRENISSDGTSTECIDHLIENTVQKFTNALDSVGGCASPSQAVLNFKEWAHELQCALKLHDPFFLSLELSDNESDDGEGHPQGFVGAPKSWATIQSQKIVKLAPLGKTGNNNLAYLEKDRSRSVKYLRAVVFCAWMFALTLTVLALTFLTNEFIASQKRPAIRIENIPTEELALPVISFCTDWQSTPSFHTYPTSDFPGYPLFLVTSLENQHDGNAPPVNYPNSVDSSSIQESFLRGNDEKCQRDLSIMSIARARQSLFRFQEDQRASTIGVDKVDPDPCQKCFSVGKTRPLLLSSKGNRSPLRLPVSVSVAVSRLYSYCIFKYTTDNARGLFMSELLRHLEQLEEREILRLPTSPQREKEIAFDPDRQLDHIGLDDMVCSVYFFSGYFYPSEDAGKVQFEWKQGQAGYGSWHSIGSKKYTKYNYSPAAPFFSGPGSDSLHKDTSFSKSIELYYEDSASVSGKETNRVNADSQMSILKGPSSSFVYLDRTEKPDGALEYQAKVSTSADVFPASSGSAFKIWTVGFDYLEFATKSITEQPTMSWPEYVTDVFEFIGLFTGVCVFSMIVAPSQALV